MAVAVPRTKYEFLDVDLERVSFTKPWPKAPEEPEEEAPPPRAAVAAPSFLESVVAAFTWATGQGGGQKKKAWTAAELGAMSDDELFEAARASLGRAQAVNKLTRPTVIKVLLRKQKEKGAGSSAAPSAPPPRPKLDEWDGSKNRHNRMISIKVKPVDAADDSSFCISAS